MTAAVLAMPARTMTGPAVLNLCDQPIITSACASLTGPASRETTCGGPLAYQAGGWHHVITPGTTRWCDDPQPQLCQHGGCDQPITNGTTCAYGHDSCDGCCWTTGDPYGPGPWA